MRGAVVRARWCNPGAVDPERLGMNEFRPPDASGIRSLPPIVRERAARCSVLDTRSATLRDGLVMHMRHCVHVRLSELRAVHIYSTQCCLNSAYCLLASLKLNYFRFARPLRRSYVLYTTNIINTTYPRPIHIFCEPRCDQIAENPPG